MVDTTKTYTDSELDAMNKGSLLLLCESLGVASAKTVGPMRAALKEHFASAATPSPPPTKKAKKDTPPAEAEVVGKWQWLAGGSYVDYDLATSTLIEDAFKAGKASASLPPSRGQTYVISFADMQQTNTTAPPYKKRAVRRVSAIDGTVLQGSKTTPAAAKPASTPKPSVTAPPRPTASPTPDDAPHSPTTSTTAAKSVVKASPDDIPPEIETATCTLTPVEKDSEEFWELEEKFNAHIQGRNEDYVSKRLEKKLKPISFVLKSAEKVNNPVLEKRFEIRKAKMAQVISNKNDLRERISFHGTHPKNIANMCKTSLLRFKHPLNPCTTQADDGYFGTNKKGVYVSRYADYTFKYANRLVPLEPGETAKVVMFRTLPGRSKHIEKLVGPIDPTEGYDSHSSPSFLEWYLFSEDQLCPEYVLTVLAKEDTRTASDDQ